MATRLTANVFLRDPHGAWTCLEAGSVLPEWAVGRVTQNIETDESGPSTPKPVEVDVTVHDSDGTVREGTTEPVPSPAEPGPPPKGGKGSSDTAWTAYARAHDVQVTDDMTRREVIAACEAAGVPTE